MSAAIKIQNLTKIYKDEKSKTIIALQDLSLEIEQGKFNILLGPTGCGKTTTLNIIAGLEKPNKGEINMPEPLEPGRDISCVFQHYTLFPWLSVLDNTMFAMLRQGVKRKPAKRTACQLLENVGLDGFENLYPHQLSGGMRQRAAISQALAVRPQLLLMDEPFGALDQNTRSSLRNLLIDICSQRQITVVFVTHSIDEAIILGDKVLLFSPSPGKIIDDISIDIPRPRNPDNIEYTNILMKIRKKLSFIE